MCVMPRRYCSEILHACRLNTVLSIPVYNSVQLPSRGTVTAGNIIYILKGR